MSNFVKFLLLWEVLDVRLHVLDGSFLDLVT